MAGQVFMTTAEFKAFGLATQGETRAMVAERLDEKSSVGARKGRAATTPPPAAFRAAGAAFGAAGRALRAIVRTHGGSGLLARTYTDHGSRVAIATVTRGGLALGVAAAFVAVGLALLVCEGSIRAIGFIVRSMRS